MKKTTLALLLCAALVLSACNTTPNNDDTPDNQDSDIGDTTVDTSNTDIVPSQTYTLPENFVFPITDGSTSTINLDKAVRSAILGDEQTVSHSKTYTAFNNLLDGKCELIFTTPLSEDQLETMEYNKFKHEAEPVAGEGFVFVVNKDNPVDTLTIEQLKGIYSGEITNWKDVGGNDAEIIAYQRNADSGSQNYMISFMGDTPLMKPITDQTPATMSGILDVIAHYDNGIDAIGYSVYAYSDGMYEDIAKIKYIKVNGVEPSLDTLADGTYPLLGYNYAVFSADLPEDSNVRLLVKWIQSDEGQQVISDAGYVPYRKVDGITLPNAALKKMYTAIGTSGIEQPMIAADYYYECRKRGYTFTDDTLNKKVSDFIAKATEELSAIDKEKKYTFIKSRNVSEMYGGEIQTSYELVNGYLSIAVGLQYGSGWEDSPDYYYDVRTAVFDIYTGEQLELSDLFFKGDDFIPILNTHLANESEKPYSTWGSTHEMLRDFSGLYEGDFTFTANSIIFKPSTCFADGVELSLDGIFEHMVTSVPRDMSGYIEDDVPVYRCLRVFSADDIGYGEETSNEITHNMGIWYFDKDKTTVPDEVCDKINAFIKKTYDEHYTKEKLTELLSNAGITPESMEVGPFPDFYLSVHGDRYIRFAGTNRLMYNSADGYGELPIIDGHDGSINFAFHFNAKTGEPLKIADLFIEGFEDSVKLFVDDENFSYRDTSTATEYTGNIDMNSAEVVDLQDYDSPPFSHGDLRDIETPVYVIVRGENGVNVAVSVPRELIKGDPYEHFYTFVYDGAKYDLSKIFPGVNAVGEWERIGKYVITWGHINPYNSAFAVINTETKKIEHHFGGSAPTYHSDDINTIVYAFWEQIKTYDGTVIATLDLADGEYIRELTYSDDFQKIEVTIANENGDRTVIIDSLPHDTEINLNVIYDEYIFEYSFYPMSLINYVGNEAFMLWLESSEPYEIDETNNIIPRNIVNCLKYFNITQDELEKLYYTNDYYSLIYDLDIMYNGTREEICRYFKDFEKRDAEYESRINILDNKMHFRRNISKWTNDENVIKKYNEIPITAWTFADIIYDANIPRAEVEAVFASTETYDAITGKAKFNCYDIDQIFGTVSEMTCSNVMSQSYEIKQADVNYYKNVIEWENRIIKTST